MADKITLTPDSDFSEYFAKQREAEKPARRKVTSKAKSWLFKAAHKLVRTGKVANMSDALKAAWVKVKAAAGFPVEPVRNLNGFATADQVLSIKALARGQRRKVFGNTFATHTTSLGV